jgi:lipoprotein-anchoring transpeptidase ErfK/SrfK
VIARTVLSALVVTLAAAPAAAAQDPVPTPTPIPTPAPAPAPAAGTASVRVENAIRDGKTRLQLAGDDWRVRGTVKPFVAGQTIRVRFSRGGKAVKTKRVKLKPGPNGTGTFLLGFKAASAGRFSVVATHKATPQLEALRSRAAHVRVLTPSVSSGQRGAIVRLLQRGLRKLHYAVPRSGVYDSATQRAVMAWRKLSGVARNYSASSVVIRGVLAGKGRFKVRHPKDGHHVEADLSRQVLALIDGDKVRRIYHTSSGAPSTPTVLGRYKVYRKDLGTNGLGMVDASYFVGGYAIHGYVSVPAFNASHGCLRVPVPDARRIYDWLNYGDVVWVYP